MVVDCCRGRCQETEEGGDHLCDDVHHLLWICEVFMSYLLELSGPTTKHFEVSLAVGEAIKP